MSQTRDPKVVFFDLEVLADMKEVRKVFFGIGNYPGLTLKASINSIICFGYKIQGEKTKCINAWDFKNWNKNINDDSAVAREAFEILKDADAVVTHNGKRFDWKFMQTRLMKHGLPPLPNIRHVDTCALAKRHLYLFNNKLDTIGKFLVNDQKIDNGGGELWCRVADKDPSAMELMTRYCIQDVNLLEKVFKKLRPFANQLPNHNLFTVAKSKLCPTCGSTRLKSHGYHINKTTTYHRYRCRDCDAFSMTNVADELPRSI